LIRAEYSVPIRPSATTRQMVVDSQDHAVAVGGVDHGLGIRDAEGNWLFDENVLSRVGGGNRFTQVLVIAGRDINGVDVAREKLVEVSGLTLNTAVGPVGEPAGFVVV
jgi:hypothetical protein